MAGSRRRFAVLGCILGAAVLIVGISAASGAKLKTKEASTTIGADDLGSATATCKKGTRAVSGAFESELDAGGPTEAILPYTSLAQGRRKWTSAGFNLGDSGDLTSFAYCRDQKVKRESSETTLSEDETGSVTAKCPRGTKVASGGFDNPDFDAEASNVAIFPNVSMRTGKREWTVTAIELGNDPGTLVAQVSCHDKPKGLKTVEETTIIDEAGVWDATAECAPRRRVVSGGFDFSLPASEEAFVFASHKVSKRQWEVEAVDFDQAATLTAFAYCEKT